MSQSTNTNQNPKEIKNDIPEDAVAAKLDELKKSISGNDYAKQSGTESGGDVKPNENSEVNQEMEIDSEPNDEMTEETLAENFESKPDQEFNLAAIQLEAAKLEIEDWKQKALSLKFTLESSTRQAELEKEQTSRKSKKEIINTVLPFLNALNLAFDYSGSSDPKKILETLDASKNKLVADLLQIGVEVLYAKPEDIYDPEFMNAINSVETEFTDLVVANMVSPGVKISNVLIQPVTVLVKGI